jgi:hypothetical protein
MGKQYNKDIKKQRRKAYLKRKNTAVKAKRAPKAAPKAAAAA